MAANLVPRAHAVRWNKLVPEPRPGVYVISLNSEAESLEGTVLVCPVSEDAVRQWLAVRPELRLDGERPTVRELRERVAGFWLPDEVVLYIGLTKRSLRKRVAEYYKTPLGARKPHAGGHFLKTLSNLGELHVYFVPASEPAAAEDAMLKAFCAGASPKTLRLLLDPDRPFPFANLEWPAGTRKRHGLTGTKESRT